MWGERNVCGGAEPGLLAGPSGSRWASQAGIVWLQLLGPAGYDQGWRPVPWRLHQPEGLRAGRKAQEEESQGLTGAWVWGGRAAIYFILEKLLACPQIRTSGARKHVPLSLCPGLSQQAVLFML